MHIQLSDSSVRSLARPTVKLVAEYNKRSTLSAPVRSLLLAFILLKSANDPIGEVLPVHKGAWAVLYFHQCKLLRRSPRAEFSKVLHNHPCLERLPLEIRLQVFTSFATSRSGSSSNFHRSNSNGCLFIR